jgi:hypothetical protein
MLTRTGVETRLKTKLMLFRMSWNDVKLKMFIRRSLRMFTRRLFRINWNNYGDDEAVPWDLRTSLTCIW